MVAVKTMTAGYLAIVYLRPFQAAEHIATALFFTEKKRNIVEEATKIQDCKCQVLH